MLQIYWSCVDAATESKWDLTALFACQQLYNIVHCCVSRHIITVKEILQCRKCQQKKYLSKLSVTINLSTTVRSLTRFMKYDIYEFDVTLYSGLIWTFFHTNFRLQFYSIVLPVYPTISMELFFQQLLEKQLSADSQQCRWSQSLLDTSTSYHVSCAVESMT